MEEVLETLSILPMNRNPDIFVGIISFNLNKGLASQVEEASAPLLIKRYDKMDKWCDHHIFATSKMPI